MILSGFLVAGSLLSPNRLHAQAAPGPLSAPESQDRPAERPQPVAKPRPTPQVPPRTTLAGAWKFNHDESDDPLQKVRTVESTNSPNTNRSPGGGYPGGGYPGGYPGG